MSIKLTANAYGKNAINLSRIIRHPEHHEFRQITVNVLLAGDFETAHTQGDNSKVLPTDTQKNTVYALSREYLSGAIEHFGLALCDHFMQQNSQLDETCIEIIEHSWARIQAHGALHPHAFINSGVEKRITQVTQNRADTSIRSGIRDLLILKTTGSAFTGYIHDDYTILKETDDRILSTQCEILWDYMPGDHSYNDLYQGIRDNLLVTFANHHSLSVQHTLYEMGKDALEQFSEIREVHFKMPNKHHIPVDLEPFGLKNQNDVFVATDEPYGYITGSVGRG